MISLLTGPPYLRIDSAQRAQFVSFRFEDGNLKLGLRNLEGNNVRRVYKAERALRQIPSVFVDLPLAPPKLNAPWRIPSRSSAKPSRIAGASKTSAAAWVSGIRLRTHVFIASSLSSFCLSA